MTRQELGHLAATRPAALVVYLSERRRPRAVTEMIYGVHAPPFLKPANARRLQK